MTEMMDDFKKFVLEQFGKEIVFKKSDKIDTFESIFGASFIDKEELKLGINLSNYSGNKPNTSLGLERDSAEEYDLLQNITLAA